MRDRHWSAYLRLLPGGDNDITSALAASGILYVLLFLVTLGPSYHYARTMAPPGFEELLPLIGAGALPALVLAAWTGLRVHRTQAIQPDEVAASTEDDRTWRGDTIARVPKTAQIVSTGPRYLVVDLADGSRRRLWYRAGQEERQLLRLARSLRKRAKDRERAAEKKKKAAREAREAAEGEAETTGSENPDEADSSGDETARSEAEATGSEVSDEADSSDEFEFDPDLGDLERLVEEGISKLAAELLPDPLAVEACLRERLDEVGVVLTRGEPW
ncbi:MAG: hypothetical protein JKY65_07845 [Planctomycetes bacterium]|nr:hypothetical protein [Planctomycetota bacterium]